MHVVEITIANTAPSQPPPKSGDFRGGVKGVNSSPIFGTKMGEVRRGLLASALLA